MIQRVPSAQTLHNSLMVEKPEVSFVVCPTCKASGCIEWPAGRAVPRAVIRLMKPEQPMPALFCTRDFLEAAGIRWGGRIVTPQMAAAVRQGLATARAIRRELLESAAAKGKVRCLPSSSCSRSSPA